MKSWSWKRGDGGRQDGTSSTLTETPLEPFPRRTSLDHRSDHDLQLLDLPSSTPSVRQGSVDEDEEGAVKKRWRSVLPLIWRSVLQKRGRGDAESERGSGGIRILPNGTRVSPPVSPLLGRGTQDSQASSLGSRRAFPMDPLLPALGESELSSLHPAEYYAEKLEVYRMKYSYLKSWPGLLRLLAGLQLLFGGMVFACVCAYIQKDSQWSNAYGLYNGLYNNGLGVSGYYYSGPMTPFVLAVVGLSWVVTLILLVMGLTMYYRSILLDSPWWPLTEAAINVALFLLYMAAGIVYLNDLNRGGLCSMTVGVNPVMSGLCRVDGGQMAGTAFIFITMAMYLVSFLVCLKMWRHEATRRERQLWESEEQHPQPRRTGFEEEKVAERQGRSSHVAGDPGGKPSRQPPVGLNTPGPAGLNTPGLTAFAPQPRLVVADYILKYPEIVCVEERESYRAVFSDQYQEYRDLYAEVSSALTKFREMDAMMDRLLREESSQREKKRIKELLKKYEQKKSDTAFQEKKERCDYLKAKLSHIKGRIRDFDRATEPPGPGAGGRA